MFILIQIITIIIFLPCGSSDVMEELQWNSSRQPFDWLKISLWCHLILLFLLLLLLLLLPLSDQFSSVSVWGHGFSPPPWPPFSGLLIYGLRSSANPPPPPLLLLLIPFVSSRLVSSQIRCVHDVWEEMFSGGRLLLSSLPAWFRFSSSSDEVRRDVLQCWRSFWEQNLELRVVQSADTATPSRSSPQRQPWWRRRSKRRRTDSGGSLWTRPGKLRQERG